MTSSDEPMDHEPPYADANSKSPKSEFEKNITTKSTWVRLAFMIIYTLLYGLSRLITAAVVVVQFVTFVITGSANEQLKEWGHSLAIYAFEVTDYLTFNSEVKPFPFGANWPDGSIELGDSD